MVAEREGFEFGARDRMRKAARAKELSTTIEVNPGVEMVKRNGGESVSQSPLKDKAFLVS
jgi:hypothetical protein